MSKQLPTDLQRGMMFGISAEKLLPWADGVYFAAIIIAAIATGLSVVAGLTQYRLNRILSAARDADFLVLKNQNLELSIKLEKERSARLQLEGSVASRMPTPEQFATLESALKGKIDLPFLNVLVVNDPEARNFALWIINALFALRDRVKLQDIPLDSEVARFHQTDVALYSFNKEKDELAKALEKSGLVRSIIDFSQIPNGKSFFGFPRNADTLVIGRKEPALPLGLNRAAP